MSAVLFVQAMFESGRVRVSSSLQPPEDLAEAMTALDLSARSQIAFDAPTLLPAVGEWALLAIYRACQALVYREIPGQAVTDALSQPCPAEPSPAACYSADLALCLLPDLVKLARGIASEDPLVEGMMTLARRWPLSSVGIKDLGGVDIAGFIEHPSLRRLYADRIIERADLARLDDPAAREAVREALGAHPELAPQLAASLEQHP